MLRYCCYSMLYQSYVAVETVPHGDIGGTCVPPSGCVKVDVCVLKTLVSEHIDWCWSTVREKLLLAGIHRSR